jgi:hypothetical protein
MVGVIAWHRFLDYDINSKQRDTAATLIQFRNILAAQILAVLTSSTGRFSSHK